MSPGSAEPLSHSVLAELWGACEEGGVTLKVDSRPGAEDSGSAPGAVSQKPRPTISKPFPIASVLPGPQTHETSGSEQVDAKNYIR